MRFVVYLLVALAVGCSASGDVCREAADHVAACTGEMPAELGTCDPDVAASVLDTSCDELATMAGKADGLLDDILCALGFTSHCPADLPRTLSGQIQKFGSTDPVTTVFHVRAIREGMPGEVKGGFTFAGSFSIGGLVPATYRVEVSLAPNSAAIASQTVDLASTSFVIIHVPL